MAATSNVAPHPGFVPEKCIFTCQGSCGFLSTISIAYVQNHRTAKLCSIIYALSKRIYIPGTSEIRKTLIFVTKSNCVLFVTMKNIFSENSIFQFLRQERSVQNERATIDRSSMFFRGWDTAQRAFYVNLSKFTLLARFLWPRIFRPFLFPFQECDRYFLCKPHTIGR